MIKEETLELLCAAINDCDNAKMTQTSETLRALLSDLEKLKKTGLVRRFDDLGRINIPREIRRGIFGSRENSEGQPMEIFLSGDCIVLKRYDAGNDEV